MRHAQPSGEKEDALANLLDTTSAADILAGLPNRIHEVIVPHVARKPKHPAFIQGGRVWTYRAFADAVEAVAAATGQKRRIVYQRALALTDARQR